MQLVANYEVQDFIAVFDASAAQVYVYKDTPYPLPADITWDDNRKASAAIVNVSNDSLVYSQSTGLPVVRNRETVVLAGINGLYQNGYRTSDMCPESACHTGPSLELSSRLEAGGCAVRASPGRLGSLAQPQRRGTSP